MAAHALGAAVVLPSEVYSRKNCHFDSRCYKEYSASVLFEEAFDVGLTSRALAAAGVCVLSASEAVTRFPSVTPPVLEDKLTLPTSMTELRARRESIASAVAGRVWSLAGEAACCTLVVPDSMRSAALWRRVNAAFTPAPSLRSLAQEVVQLFRQRTLEASAVGIALHWRGQPDMTGPDHLLNATGYSFQTARALVKMRNEVRDCAAGRRCAEPASLSLLALGGFSASTLEQLRLSLVSALTGLGEDALGRSLALHSKETLLPIDYGRRYGGNDDIVGLLDFEVARLAPAFVGSPFSSFSVVAAAANCATSTDVRIRLFQESQRWAVVGALHWVSPKQPDHVRHVYRCLRRRCLRRRGLHSARGVQVAQLAFVGPSRRGRQHMVEFLEVEVE